MTALPVALDSIVESPGLGPTPVLTQRSMSVITDRPGLAGLASSWSALEANVSGALLFQSMEWAEAVFAFEARRQNSAFDPVIVAASEGGRLVGVLPLERIRTSTRTELVPLGHAFAQYSDVLLDPQFEPADIVPLLLDAALAMRPCDLVAFRKVRDDSTLRRGLPPHAIRSTETTGAPFVALTDYPDFAAYHPTIRLKTRKNMRNARNRLEREAPLTHVVADAAEELRGIVARTVEGRAERLRELGLTSRAFRDGDFADFCQLLTEPGVKAPKLLAMSLRHGGKPIAEQWGFLHNGRYYAYVTSRDFGQLEESPGKLHMKEVIETCFARGLKTADLLVPSMPYKLTWATGEMPVADYAIPVTAWGQVSVRLWDGTLRPLLKRLVLAMPRQVRQLLLKISGQR